MGPDLTRAENWRRALFDILDAAEERSFSWGGNDCFIFCGDAIAAVVGRDIFAEYEFRGHYSSPHGAVRLLLKHGCRGMADVWDRYFERIPVKFAGAGDLVMIDVRQLLPATGIVVDTRAAFLTTEGLAYRQVEDARAAWRVG